MTINILLREKKIEQSVVSTFAPIPMCKVWYSEYNLKEKKNDKKVKIDFYLFIFFNF